MKIPADNLNVDQLSALGGVSIERLKQPEAAQREFMSVRSKLTIAANEARTKAKTPEEKNAVQEKYSRQCARLEELYWAYWPHRTSAFQLACVAAPLVAAKMDAGTALTQAKSLLILAEAHLEQWKNPLPRQSTEFTVDQALERINERAETTLNPKLRHWKGTRPLRQHLRAVVGEMTKEAFEEFWEKAKVSPEISSYNLIDIFALRVKNEKAKQEKAAAGKRGRSGKL